MCEANAIPLTPQQTANNIECRSKGIHSSISLDEIKIETESLSPEISNVKRRVSKHCFILI